MVVAMLLLGTRAARAADSFQTIDRCLDEVESSIKQIEKLKKDKAPQSGREPSSPAIVELEKKLAADEQVLRSWKRLAPSAVDKDPAKAKNQLFVNENERGQLLEKVLKDQQAIHKERSALSAQRPLSVDPKRATDPLVNETGAKAMSCNALIEAFEPKGAPGRHEKQLRFKTLSGRLSAITSQPADAAGKKKSSKKP